MSTITELNNKILAATQPQADPDAPRATWVKLRKITDPVIVGELIDIEITERRDPKGNVICYQKSGDPRHVWILTFEPLGTDEVHKVELNESAQRAMEDAIRDSGTPIRSRIEDGVGSSFTLRVAADPKDQYSQAEYEASHDQAVEQLALPVDDSF